MAVPSPSSPSSRAGAEAVLRELHWLRGLALRLVRDEHAAADVVQDTWVAAAERGPAGLEGRGLRAWLATVARNVVRRRGRDESVRRRHETARLLELAEAEPPDEVERLRRQRQVADLVLALREPYRSAVLLRYQEGLSYARLAARHAITTDAARKRVSRGLALLRERLDHDHDGDRRAWSAVLLGLVDRTQLAPVATAVSLGGITMGIKTLAVAAVSLVAAVGMFVWLGEPGAVRQPAEAAPATVASSGLEAPEVLPERSLDGLVEPPAEARSATAPELVGAVAAADPERDLHGRVLDPRGQPLPGAEIVVRRDELSQVNKLDLDHDKRGTVIARTEADALGEFALPLEPGHPFVLLVEHPGYASAKLIDRYAGEFVEVRLDQPAVLAGRVFRASDGQGVPAQVKAWGRDGGVVHVIESRTRPDGTFRFDGLQARTLTVEIHPEGAADPDWQSVDLVAGETVTLDVACPAGDVLRGTVTDAATGRPIAGAEVGQGWVFDRPVTTNTRGEYVFEHFKLEGIWEVAARAKGYGRRLHEITSSAAGLVVDFALVPARRVVGRVVDPQGEPLAEVYVAAIASVHTGTQQTDWCSTRTLADGTFELTDVRADIRHVLRLYRSGFADAAYDFPDDALERTFLDVGTIALEPPSRLAGVVVTPVGEPLPECRVTLDGVNADRDLLGGTPATAGLHYIGRRSGRTDDRGRFTFADLSAGSYELAVRLHNGPETTRPVEIPAATVVDGLTVEFSVGLELSGRVVDPDGEPVFCVVVAQAVPMMANGMFQALSGQDGSFRLSGLSAGTFDLEAHPVSDGGKPLLNGQLAGVEAGATGIEIVMPLGEVISGWVLAADGAPILNATVRGLDPDGRIATMDTTDSEGRFELSLEAGQTVDLVATPPPVDAEFYDFQQVPEELGTRRDGVPAGSRDLVLELPERP